MGKEEGFWQEVYYESLPSYYTNCSQQGHPTGRCTVKKPATMNTKEKVGNFIFSFRNLLFGFREESSDVARINQRNTCPVFFM